MEKEEIEIVNKENLKNKIYLIRGQKVMLDRDLAEIYGYTLGSFNRQVKNNSGKFKIDFMFQLSRTEWENLKCNFCISSWGGDRGLPYAFTEQGIYMLNDFQAQNPTNSISLHKTNNRFHDRYIIIDYKTENEVIYHCGPSSKDAGNRIGTIVKIKEKEVYIPLVADLLEEII